MELKTNYAILIATLIAGAPLNSVSVAKHTAVESVVIVLAHPETRAELQVLFSKARIEGLSNAELKRTLELSKISIEKLSAGPAPMLIAEI